MDFIEGLLVSEGKDTIFVVVERSTKYAHFMGIKKTDSAKQIAEVFCKNIYKLLKYFVKIFTNYMDFPKSSLVTEMPKMQTSWDHS